MNWRKKFRVMGCASGIRASREPKKGMVTVQKIYIFISMERVVPAVG